MPSVGAGMGFGAGFLPNGFTWAIASINRSSSVAAKALNPLQTVQASFTV